MGLSCQIGGINKNWVKIALVQPSPFDTNDMQRLINSPIFALIKDHATYPKPFLGD